MSAELVRPHFSTKVYKCYLTYLRKNYPELDIEKLCRDSGLPLHHIENENNWVSVQFDTAFTLGAIEACQDTRIPFEAGRQNASPQVLGKLVHLMVRLSLSLTLVYRMLPRLTSFFTNVTELKLISEMDGIATYHFRPKDLDKLSPKELQAFQANYHNVLQNTLGHYSALPLVKSKLPALVKYKEILEEGPLPAYEIEVNYRVSEHPLRKIVEKSIPAASLGTGLVALVLGRLYGLESLESVVLGSMTALLFLVVRGAIAQRGMGQLLESLARDYEILDRKYEGVQRTKERFSRIASRSRNYRHLFDELDLGIAVVQGPSFENPKITLSNGALNGLSSHLRENLIQKQWQHMRDCRFKNSAVFLPDIPIEEGGKTRYFSLRMFPVGRIDVAIFVLETTESVITQRQVAEERAKADQASHLAALGEVAAGISHELNNPLSVVTLLCDQAFQLNKGQRHDEVPPVLEKVQKHLDRMSKIIDSVKRLSRERGTIQKSPISAQSLLNSVAELCEERLEITRSELTVEVRPADLLVTCNEIDMIRALVNLVHNACDAISELNIRNIKVVVTSDGEWTKIEVIDSGTGVPEEIRDQVLNPFFTTKRVGKGTGLGLSLTANIVEKHKGKIEIVSGLPSTFRILLPITHTQKLSKRSSQSE